MLRSLDDDIPPLDKRRNHTIEVVVDRLLVKPGIEKRLEASIDTATKLANGLVLIAVVNGEERLYSQKLACTECGTSVPQLEPRSFSFNSPYGACEDLLRAGQPVDVRSRQGHCGCIEAAAEGGLGPGASSAHMNHWLNEASRILQINSQRPSTSSPRRRRSCCSMAATAFPAFSRFWTRAFEDASEGYREWLTDYMSPAECPDCHGKRLRPSSLAVRVKAISIADFTAMPIARALLTARRLGVRRARDADCRPRGG